MHDESISQAEINALVRGLTGAGGALTPPSPPPGESAVESPFHIFTTAASRAFAEMVSMPCMGTVTEVSDATVESASARTVGPVYVGKLSLSSGLSGTIYMVLPDQLASAMIMQIYGGVAPSTMDESARGALSDGLSQMGLAGLGHWSDILDRPLVPAPLELHDGPSLAEVTGESAGLNLKVATVNLTIADDHGRVLLLVTKELYAAVDQAARERRQKARTQAQADEGGAPAPRGQVAAGAASGGIKGAPFPELTPGTPREDIRNIDLLMDVTLQLTVELGRTRRQIRDVLSLGPGSVVELDKLAGEQVDVLVNGKLIAKGEVVVIDENYGVRITDILSPAERVQSLRQGER
jgi:flagellar motor switch protein FliN/FliY